MTSVPDLAPRTPPAVSVDEQTLRYLGYDPNSVATRAMVLLAEKYELDPLLAEIELIKTKAGVKPYVTRDGMLVIAHRSGFLDGIVVEQQRRNSTNDGWTAYVSVWRKDMSHPFTYGAQCKDSEPQAASGNGPEQALARAERRALRRAFQIHDGVDTDDGEVGVAAPTAMVQSPGHTGEARSGDWTPPDSDQAEARRVVANLNVKARLSFLQRHHIEHFDQPWPPAAVAEILAGPPDARDTAPSAGPASTEL